MKTGTSKYVILKDDPYESGHIGWFEYQGFKGISFKNGLGIDRNSYGEYFYYDKDSEYYTKDEFKTEFKKRESKLYKVMYDE